MPTLVVLAAGIGNRYGGLKQMDPVGPHGATLIDYSIFDAIKAKFETLVFIIRPVFEAAFREQLLSKFEQCADCHCVYQGMEDWKGHKAAFAEPPKKDEYIRVAG